MTLGGGEGIAYHCRLCMGGVVVGGGGKGEVRFDLEGGAVRR